MNVTVLIRPTGDVRTAVTGQERCCRCHRRIKPGSKYHDRNGLTIGMICNSFVRELEESGRFTSPQQIASAAHQQFLFQTKVLTVEAMEAAGLL